MNVVVLADTHLRTAPDGSLPRWLPAAAEAHLGAADLILHAGDLLDGGVLERLRRYAPVHAVLGNNDRDLLGVLPPTVLVDLEGVRVAMVHDSGPAAGRATRMRRRYPDAQVVVFGHSHAPVNEPGHDGQLLFNPGSAVQRRRQPNHTLGRLVIDDGTIVESRIIGLD
jgi:putative phosphoesterase